MVVAVDMDSNLMVARLKAMVARPATNRVATDLSLTAAAEEEAEEATVEAAVEVLEVRDHLRFFVLILYV